MTAEIIDGVDKVPLQAVNLPGSLEIVAEAAGAHGAPAILRCAALQAAAPIPVVAIVDIVEGGLAAQAGPFTGVLGAIVNDGESVDFRFTAQDDMTLTTESPIDGGHGIAEIRLWG